MNDKLPPIGLRPKWVWEIESLNNRIGELCQAINRYLAAGEKIPEAWTCELTDRLAELQQHIRPK